MGKSTISMAMFNSKPLNYQRVNPPSHPSQIVVLRIKKVVLSQKFLSGFHTTLPRPQSLTTTRLTRVPLEKKHTIFRVPIGFLDHLWSSMIISIHFAYWSIAVLALNHPENAENRYRRIIPAPTHHVGCLDEDALPLFLINGVVHPSPGASFEQPKKDWLNGVQYVCPFFVISNGWEIWPCLKRSNLGDVSQIRLPDGPKSKSSNLDGDDPLIINRWS